MTSNTTGNLCLLILALVFSQVSGNDTTSTLIAFATKSISGGQLTSKLHVIELGAQPGKDFLYAFSVFCTIQVLLSTWLPLIGSETCFNLAVVLIIRLKVCYFSQYWHGFGL